MIEEKNTFKYLKNREPILGMKESKMSIKSRAKGKSSKRRGSIVTKGCSVAAPKRRGVKNQSNIITRKINSKFLEGIEGGIADKKTNKNTVKLVISSEDKEPNSIGEYIKQKSAINHDFKRKVDEHNTRLAAAIAVQDLRDSLGLSQREFAELVHKPQSTIARIELGSTNVKMSTLREIGEQTNKKLVIKFV